MLITVINPNTSVSMTETIGRAARSVASIGTEIAAVTPPMGPASIESHYDEALAVPGVLHEIARAEAAGSDGAVIACFGDPGVDAAREVASGPVIGVAEAAMHMATLVGRGFSVVTTLSRTSGRAWDIAQRAGFGEACRQVRACDVPVLELEDPRSDARRLILAECRAALAADGSDSIVLGCAGMADLCRDLSRELGVPVIDGVVSAVRLVEGLVAMGVTTSRRDEFATPRAKAMSGLLAPFELA
ncbi:MULTISPECIES: aspartate/glutamate racemase family protein [unclassified Rathayibacter]|uniref:aspartate/glutamate racemase family protein n=1 Tax=unclassified Rathayibacter TaxID=2609250 RepID=UPI00188CFDF9|nr:MULTISPECIES: aspartate/glutamate racemase family protein [unclassified Rathayibacter]MBF4462998.1 aspartate/glutamate racemase family protein [Rathayibacter sp. VKM Ac-2879]MBF4504412.1 aspartate/glutamate racemase family protein [Rathayibacter sp. VKM Ac-2878]